MAERPTLVSALPFWQRIPRFFALPLELPVAARIVLLAAATAGLPSLVADGRVDAPFALVVALALYLAGAAYGFTIIDRSALGFLFPSRYPRGARRRWSVVFQYLVLVAALALAMVAVAIVTASAASAIVVSVLLFAGIMPVLTIRLIATGTLAHGVAPAESAGAIAGIGRPYLALCAFLAALELARWSGPLFLLGAAGLSPAALGAAGLRSSGPLAGATPFAAGLLHWYLTYVGCALLGYVVYQYAERLGVPVVGRGDRMRAGTLVGRVDLERRARDAAIDRIAAAGEIDAAIAMVEEDMRIRPNDLALHARLHRLLRAQGDATRIENHADRLIVLLTRTGSAAEALPIVADLATRTPDWRPRDPQQVAPLARAALDAGRLDLAAHLVRGFDRRFRNHEDLPEIYLIGALASIRSAGPSPQATHLLERVAYDFPRHPAAAEALLYLQRLPDAAATGPGART